MIPPPQHPRPANNFVPTGMFLCPKSHEVKGAPCMVPSGNKDPNPEGMCISKPELSREGPFGGGAPGRPGQGGLPIRQCGKRQTHSFNGHPTLRGWWGGRVVLTEEWLVGWYRYGGCTRTWVQVGSQAEVGGSRWIQVGGYR